jgi:hypothetical protein
MEARDKWGWVLSPVLRSKNWEEPLSRFVEPKLVEVEAEVDTEFLSVAMSVEICTLEMG